MGEYISFYELHLVASLVTTTEREREKEREREQDVLSLR